MNRKRIVIAGGSGFLGRLLAAHFSKNNFDVVILSRNLGDGYGLNSCRTLQWDGRTLGPWSSVLEGADAVLNLAGRTVNCRYNEKNRHEILNSRVDSTRALGQAIARCATPPRVWLNASTATIYKHSLGTPMTESGEISATAEAKDEFSIEVAQAWEKAFADATTPRTRKVALRMAMVLGTEAGTVFRVLRRLVRFGLGGRMGHGRQYVSWIHEKDFCKAIEFLVGNQDMSGVVNISSPNPIPNAQLMRELRHVCHRPFGLPATRWMLELGAFFLRTETELIVKSRRVVPARLEKAGFQFSFPGITEALEDLNARVTD